MKFIRNGLSARKPLNRFLAMFVLLMITSGCSTKVQIKPNENYQENQLALCPVTLPRQAGPTGSDFDAALKAYRLMYTDCAARHNALVGIIRQRKELAQ